MALLRFVADCMFVTSENGPFTYVSRSDDEVVCGIYFLTDPDRTVEIRFHSFDVPCDHRGLLAVRNRQLLLNLPILVDLPNLIIMRDTTDYYSLALINNSNSDKI